MSRKDRQTDRVIAQNKKAFHDYHIEERIEAGLVLEGWEVKSLRAGRAQLRDSYVILRGGEAWLINMHIPPLASVSTHFEPQPTRPRKLLLKHGELKKFYGAVQRKGYTLVPLKLYWKKQWAKVEVAYALGKKKHDKRETEKQREWRRQKQRLLKKSIK